MEKIPGPDAHLSSSSAERQDSYEKLRKEHDALMGELAQLFEEQMELIKTDSQMSFEQVLRCHSRETEILDRIGDIEKQLAKL